MDPFSVYIHLELLEVVPSRGDQRRLIMRFIRSLAQTPEGQWWKGNGVTS